MDEVRPLVELNRATVQLGTTLALDDVDFRMFPG